MRTVYAPASILICTQELIGNFKDMKDMKPGDVIQFPKLEEIEAVYDRTQILRVQDEVSNECRIVKRDIYRINVLKNGELDFVECFHQTPMSDSEVLKLLDEARHKIKIHPIA